MSLQDRENQRKSNNVVGNIIRDNTKSKPEDKEVLKPRSYYLPERLYKAIGIKAALTDWDKSSVVRAALEQYLEDILEKYKEVLD